MAEKAIDVFKQAEDELREQRFEAALNLYLRVVRGVPEYWRARFRVADTLLSFKAYAEALTIYRGLAWHAIKAGQPLEALMAIKMASFLDKSEHDTIEIIAEMYCKGAERLGEVMEAGNRRLLKPSDIAPEIEKLGGQPLIEMAAQEAGNTETMGSYPDELPSVPLFSVLDQSAFGAVLEGIQLKRFVKGQDIIVQGQPGDSFFILVEGNVEITREREHKRQRLAVLHPGAVFGEMALISQAPRTATVTAMEDCDLLELSRKTLETQAHKLKSVTEGLKQFTHDRFLANLTATSPIFKPFPKGMRTEIIKRFKEVPISEGEELIVEGQEGKGLYLIIAGTVLVTKKSDDGDATILATLKEGDVFGEIALIQDSPTVATCHAKTGGRAYFLPKPDFKALVNRHPEMRAELEKMTEERIQKNRDIMEAGDDDDVMLIEDDDLILL